MVFRMNEISIDDEIKEIIDETSKWTKLFESFWIVLCTSENTIHSALK